MVKIIWTDWAIEDLKSIHEYISKDIQGMTFEQLQAYLDKTKLQPKIS